MNADAGDYWDRAQKAPDVARGLLALDPDDERARGMLVDVERFMEDVLDTGSRAEGERLEMWE